MLRKNNNKQLTCISSINTILENTRDDDTLLWELKDNSYQSIRDYWEVGNGGEKCSLNRCVFSLRPKVARASASLTSTGRSFLRRGARTDSRRDWKVEVRRGVDPRCPAVAERRGLVGNPDYIGYSKLKGLATYILAWNINSYFIQLLFQHFTNMWIEACKI